MTLYINLVPITVGGGLQNAINFLNNLNLNELKSNDIIVIVKENEALINICEKRKISYKVINNKFTSRLYFEIFYFFKNRNSVIFTLFGTKPILSWRNKTITGCAYSNLFYKNIDFWGYLSPMKKFIKILKDKYRYFNVKSSDVVIFETELLMKKAVEDFGFNKTNTYTVKMAVSSDVNKKQLVEKSFDNINDEKYKILYLGSAHPNKRQHLIPQIILELKKRNFSNFKFIVTMNKNNAYTKKVFDEINNKNLNEYIINLEYVENKYVAKLIDKSNAMINIAALESFSNNFVEAWQMKKPLLVTDDEWAKGSCEKAAYYLDTQNIENLANQIESLIENKSKEKELIKNGIEQLKKYPTPKDKISQFVEIINKYTKD